MSKTRFEDSLQAASFMDQLQTMLNDPRLTEWCNSTDYHWGTVSASKLEQARKAYAAMSDEMDKAC